MSVADLSMMHRATLVSIALLISCSRNVGSSQPSESMGALMPLLKGDVDAIHNALAFGDFEAAESAASMLVHRSRRVSVPLELRGFATTIRRQTTKPPSSENLQEMAVSLGLVLKACGDCHQESRRIVQVDLTSTESLDPNSMLAHAYSSTQLQVGLFAPSNELWLAGAIGLMSGAFEGLAPSTTQPAASERIHALAREAYDAQTSGQKARVYGLMMSECVACHRLARQTDNRATISR